MLKIPKSGKERECYMEAQKRDGKLRMAALNSSEEQQEVNDREEGGSRATQYRLSTAMRNNVSPLLSPTK